MNVPTPCGYQHRTRCTDPRSPNVLGLKTRALKYNDRSMLRSTGCFAVSRAAP